MAYDPQSGHIPERPIEIWMEDGKWWMKRAGERIQQITVHDIYIRWGNNSFFHSKQEETRL